MRRILAIVAAVVLLLAASVLLFRRSLERAAVVLLTEDYAPEDRGLEPVFDGPDAARARVPVHLEPVAEGLRQPVDLQFVPGDPDTLLVAEKGGRVVRVDRRTGAHTVVATLSVRTDSEQGLLGLAVDPDFARTGRLWVYAIEADPDDVGRVRPLALDPRDPWGAPATVGPPILAVPQPYQNHNGGQLVFGPDGALYLALGDGGLRDDPLDVGRDPHSLLGSILRITPTADGYTVPQDNPFVDGGGAPEVFVTGLRNPWRFAFAPDGRLIVADVGQDTWEELSLASAGDDLGWSDHEGAACFPPGSTCADDAVQPFHTYGRDSGTSITGGVVATGDAVPALRGRYVFGDFTSGRLWAIVPGEAEPSALGRWPLLVSTFGRDPAGDVYLAAFGRGMVYRLTP